ncbi:MAG: FAD-dependent oxidoreductase [Nitrososphaeria archaeon]|nr:FAD-dependent oxidoreductase [Nitrososphaeria archaeon]
MIDDITRQIPVVKDVDIIVVGAGPAGVSAAIAAAREGVSVLLIERYGILGGTLAAAMVPHFDPIPLIGLKGIPREIYDRLKREGALIEGFAEKIEMPYTFWETGSAFDPEMFKLILLEMIEEANVKLLLHSLVVGSLAKEGNVCGVIVENKSGRQAFKAKVVIDATGDGDVAALSGAQFEKGYMALTPCFRIGNVDLEKVFGYFKNVPEEFGSHPRLGKYMQDYARSCIIAGFHKLVKDAIENGVLPPGYIRETGFNFHLMPRKGEVCVNTLSIFNVDALNAFELTEAEVKGRKLMKAVFDFAKKYVPGFENAYLIDSGFQIGVRETRRIIGDYVLTLEDIQNERKFDDAVVRAKWAHTDIHDPKSGKWSYSLIEGPYDIPYRCLLPKNVENLLVSGRCISTTHEALGSVRIAPICMATGQAAGAASSIAVKENVSPRKVTIQKLHTVLKKQGVEL